MNYWLLSFVWCALASVCVASSGLADDDVFPSVKARTLNKERIQVPGDFDAIYNVLLISFGRDMQETVDAWDDALAPLREGSNSIQVYNTPLIPNPGALVRGFINGGFRSIYKDKAMRDRIIILYIDKEEMFPALGIDEDDQSQPLVLVIHKNGNIIGKVSGLANEENIAVVSQLVEL